MKLHFSKRAKLFKTDALKQLLSVVSKPDIISLAGGMPAPESFPVELIQKLSAKVLNDKKALALQYNKTPGIDEVRETLANWLNKQYGWKLSAENVMITTGSTQAFDLIAKIFLDFNDKIVLEDPSYMGALWCFDTYKLNYITVKSEADGIDINELEDKLKSNKKIKFLYIVSNFQNPTGRVVELSKRRQLIDLANKYDFLIIEDDPYCHLRFEGEAIPPMKTFDTEGRIIYLSTFSKILAPGLRVAYIAADKEIISWLANAKESADLSSNTISQYIVNEYIKGEYVEDQIKKIVKIYKPRYKTMLKSLSKYFPKNSYWTEPEGGMFTWVELDEAIDTEKLYSKAIEHNVAFVPGVHFYAHKDVKNTMRLNFSNVPEENIEKGIKILGKLLK